MCSISILHLFILFDIYLVSEIDAVVKITDSNFCGWGSIPGKRCRFFKAKVYRYDLCVLISMKDTSCLISSSMKYALIKI